MSSREEILGKLGIDPSKLAGKGTKLESVEVKGGKSRSSSTAMVPVSNEPEDDDDYVAGTEDQCMEVDNWDKRKGKEIFEKHKDVINEVDGGSTLDYIDTTDLFNLAFTTDPAIKEESEMSAGRHVGRHKFITETMESPALEDLRSRTVMNFKESEAAAVEMSKQLASLSPADLDPTTPEGVAAFAYAIDKALEQAIEMVDIRGVAEDMFGPCIGPNMAQNPAEAQKLKTETIDRIFAKLQRNPWLREFMKLAGRYRATAKAKQRSKLKPGNDEITGITQGNNLERLLPCELMYLANPATRGLSMRRYVENQMGLYEIQSPNPKGEGPLIFCVDGSGSMAGAPIEHAKSLTLAGWWIAQSQKRWCMMVEFGSDREVGHTVIWAPPGTKNGPTATVEMVLEWIEHFYNAGGTSYKVPLVDIPAIWNNSDFQIPKGKTDMVIVSDGLVSIPQTMADNFVKWKTTNKVSLYTLLLGGSAAASAKNKQIVQVSDRIFDMDKLDIACEFVDTVLSI